MKSLWYLACIALVGCPSSSELKDERAPAKQGDAQAREQGPFADPSPTSEDFVNPITYILDGDSKTICLYFGEYRGESVFATGYERAFTPGGAAKTGLAIMGPRSPIPISFVAGDRDLGIAIVSTGRSKLVDPRRTLKHIDLSTLRETQPVCVYDGPLDPIDTFRNNCRISALTTINGHLTRMQINHLGNSDRVRPILSVDRLLIGMTHYDEGTGIMFGIPHSLIEAMVLRLFAQRQEPESIPTPSRDHTDAIELFEPESDRGFIKLPFIPTDWFLMRGDQQLVIHRPGEPSIHAIDLKAGTCNHLFDLAEKETIVCGGGNRLVVFYPDINIFEVLDADGELVDVFDAPVPLIHHVGMGRHNDAHLIALSGEGSRHAINVIEMSTFHVVLSTPIGDLLNSPEGNPIVCSPDMRYCVVNGWADDVLMRWDGATYDLKSLREKGYAWDFNTSLIATHGKAYSRNAKLIKSFEDDLVLVPSIDSPHILAQSQRPVSVKTNVIWVDCFLKVEWHGNPHFVDIDPERSLFFGSSRMFMMFSEDAPRLEYRRTPTVGADVPFVMIRSIPPTTYEPGTRFVYQMDVQTEKTPFSCDLIDAPDGMTVTDTGQIEWSVPKSQNLAVDVMVLITNARDVHCFHGFRLEAGTP